jgi:hypothetical protein
LAQRCREGAVHLIIPDGEMRAAASSAPIRDLVRLLNSFDEVPDSLAFDSASGMTGVGALALLPRA